MANDSDPSKSQDDAERLVLPMQNLRGQEEGVHEAGDK
jgi:hypothetical protein